MKPNITTKLAQNYFPDAYEMLPDGAFDSLSRGENVEIVSVRGANQIDIGGALGIIKLLFDVGKFIYQYRRDGVADGAVVDELKDKLRSKYDALFHDFSDEELELFIKDIQNE